MDGRRPLPLGNISGLTLTLTYQAILPYSRFLKRRGCKDYSFGTVRIFILFLIVLAPAI
jgi:hypothetical protein